MVPWRTLRDSRRPWTPAFAGVTVFFQQTHAGAVRMKSP